MLAFSDWTNFAAVIIASVITTGGAIFITKINKSVKQINRAVNHVSKGAPTLVQRVSLIERQNTVHRQWERAAFQAIGNQIGVKIPAAPREQQYIPTADEKDAQ